ncbi:hypothetical protein PtrM4_090870 [Pyrenophora tritici-repentis]|uniref:Secreted protein n=1 Tax=Pyrenophora tritici-repentis TaxID=45151 RepID=A0A834RXG2_9PLEO|nr:hypothetical protein PtrM4_090870 [Pyrenophora tritici-repentis]
MAAFALCLYLNLLYEPHSVDLRGCCEAAPAAVQQRRRLGISAFQPYRPYFRVRNTAPWVKNQAMGKPADLLGQRPLIAHNTNRTMQKQNVRVTNYRLGITRERDSRLFSVEYDFIRYCHEL